MVGILKKLLPASSSAAANSVVPNNDHDDEAEEFEYSFALEYKGPPVTCDIPQITPVHIDSIPVAAVVAPASLLNDMQCPVIQPIARTTRLNKKLSRMKNIDSESVKSVSRNSDSENVVIHISEVLSDLSSGIFSPSSSKKEKKHEGMHILRESHGSSNSMHELNRLPGSKLSGDHEEAAGSRIHTNSATWESTDSVTSSGPFSCREEDYDSESPEKPRRQALVTFHEPESGDLIESMVTSADPRENYIVDEEFTDAGSESVHVGPVAERNGKKGSCYRCLKGNRFTEKEACLVCGAKYCSKCVIRAMGSMPEGRKCITCIGYRIDESRRSGLGKCSRMLKRMLSEEIKQIMNREVSCEANQLPAELVYVNGESLGQEELHLLQSSRHPPKNLGPGRYWYDNVSGFWGKEGKKPCQIITPQLHVGGHIRRDASNGHTSVLINNREITKAELQMLKVAGVHCEGMPHFWVSADGSYQEEGMNNMKGKIWDKRWTRLYCAVISLPVPPDIESGEEVNTDSDSPGDIEQGILVDKLLLMGYSKSGTSTIFKQAKLLYNGAFSEEECQDMKLLIKSNLYGYLGIILEARERFEEESLTEKTKKQFADEPSSSGNLDVISLATTREYSEVIEDLWKDPAIQATYNRRSEIPMLPRAANYFLDKAIEISRTDYEPSEMDILYAEGLNLSNGAACVEFSLPKAAGEEHLHPDYHHDPSLRYQLIKVHPRNIVSNNRCLEMFEDVNLVIFCVALSDYDEFYEDVNGVTKNKMLESKQLFESIVTHPSFNKKDFLLILNKFDLLEEKIEQRPLTQCEWFDDFDPVISLNHNRCSSSNNCAPLAQRASHYIATKFKRLFGSLTGDCKLFISFVTALESDSVDDALRYAREIAKWGDSETTFIITEEMSYSMEESSS